MEIEAPTGHTAGEGWETPGGGIVTMQLQLSIHSAYTAHRGISQARCTRFAGIWSCSGCQEISQSAGTGVNRCKRSVLVKLPGMDTHLLLNAAAASARECVHFQAMHVLAMKLQAVILSCWFNTSTHSKTRDVTKPRTHKIECSQHSTDAVLPLC